MQRRELRREIGVLLFERERLTLAQAAELADMPQWEFQVLLAERQISIHYEVAELKEDIQTLRDLGRL